MASKHDTAWFNPETSEVHTPKGRLAYPSLFTARGIKDDPSSKPKFSATLLLPKTANVDALKKLAAEAALAKFGQGWQTKKLRSPFLKTEDQERLKEYAAEFPTLIRMSANPEFPPFVYGPDIKPFKGDESEVYSGRWAIAAVNAYAYDMAGNKGVSFGLQRIQLLDHDEPMAIGRIATASGFEAASVAGGSADAAWGDKPAAKARDIGLDDEIPF